MNEKKADRVDVMHRRKFLGTMASAAGITSLSMATTLNGFPVASTNAPLTVKQIIDRIIDKIPGAPFQQTVDTLKAGAMDQTVTGIVTSMFPTVAVIKKCVALKANFIIVHEPSFYNHLDETQWLENDKVYQYKAALLKKHGIAVWRFHDYIHTHRPDGVRMGVLTQLGWEKYHNPESAVVTIAPVSLGELVRHVKRSLGINDVNVIGEAKQTCRSVAIMPGAAGGRSQIQVIGKEQPDVMMVGEINEWETAEYVRDARAMGQNVSLIVLGHAVSEEPGLAWLVDWLTPMADGIAITHVPTGDPYNAALT